jgi:tripartite-type tricarboxylate transporter receptor subunit TctC
VPTMKEQGFDLVSYSWFGLSGPAKLPAPIVERLASEMQVVLTNPDVVKRWQEIGAESSTMTPQEYTAFVQKELEQATAAVKASGAKPEQ